MAGEAWSLALPRDDDGSDEGMWPARADTTCEVGALVEASGT
jgi:hypothetical protein